jgi:hypothetical protein
MPSFIAGLAYAARTSDLAWFVNAVFAPLVALVLAIKIGLVAAGAYLLSGAIGTLVAHSVNNELAKRIS